MSENSDKQAQESNQQQAQISEDQVNEIVNRALTAREKRLQTTLEKLIVEQMGKLTAAKQTEQAAEGDKPKPQESPEVKALSEKLVKLEKTLVAERELREKTEQSARDVSTRTKLRDALKAAGVKDDALEFAVGHLYDAKKSIRFSDDGKPLMTVTRARAKNAPAEPMDFDDLTEAAKDWAKTQEAAFFLPAPQSSKPTQQRTQGGQYAQRPQAPPVGGPVSERDAVRRTIADLESKGINVAEALLNE